MKNITQLVETRLREMQSQQDRLAESWQPYIIAINEHLKSTQDREMSLSESRNVAQCLENAFVEAMCKKQSRLFETTTEDAIQFLGIQLPVIAALLPSLVLNEIANTQALDRRIGAVFFLDMLAGSTKGGITAGDTLISSKTGHTRSIAGRRYASCMVKDEVLSGSEGASSGDTLTGTLTYHPGIDVTNKGNIVVRDSDGVNIGDNSADASIITGTGITSGTITSSSGVYSLVLAADAGSDGLTIDYDYQYDLPVDDNGNRFGVPEMDVTISQESITAKDFPVRSKWSIGAAFDLLKAHNIDELVSSYSDVCRKAA
jgi:hypothetical protein